MNNDDMPEIDLEDISISQQDASLKSFENSIKSLNGMYKVKANVDQDILQDYFNG